MLPQAVDRLRAGGVVAFPTETVYGLGADARRADAVRRVFAVKGRPSNNPLIVHVTGVEMARSVVAQWPPAAQRLADAVWPGPLSIVLPRAEGVPSEVTGGGPNVAVRCPDHPVALALLYAFGGPLVGPSANKSGRVSPTSAAHVREHFTHDEVLTLDGGECATGIESTVISLATSEPTILRPGVIGPEQLADLLGMRVKGGDALKSSTADASAHSGASPGESNATPLDAPGMLASHYAPVARTVLFDHWDEVIEFVEDARDTSSEPVIVLSHSVSAEDGGDAWHLIDMPHDPVQYAACLYSALRAADATNPPLILVHSPPQAGETPAETAIWRAIHDRLSRAAAAR